MSNGIMLTRCRTARIGGLVGVQYRSLSIKRSSTVPTRRSRNVVRSGVRPSSLFPHPHLAAAPWSTQIAHFNTRESPHYDTLKTTDQREKDAPSQHYARKLVGTHCPGCGTAFQVDRPLDPGYLTDMSDLERTSKCKQDGLPSPPFIASIPPGAPGQSKFTSTPTPQRDLPTAVSNLTQEQYLERLQSVQQLNPHLAQQLGFTEAPPAAYKDDVQSHQCSVDGIENIKTPKTTRKNERVVCHRCHSLAHHGTPLPPTAVNSPPEGFFPAPSAPPPLFLQKIHQTPTNNVAVVVVSLLDFPHSLPKSVIDLLLLPRNIERPAGQLHKDVVKGGKQDHKQHRVLRTPVVIVANKFDLLPKSSNKSRVLNYLWDWFKARDLHGNIQRIHVVSAKHPSEGDIRILLKSLGDLWHGSDRGHITLIGAENVGKSALLNAMISEGRPAPSRNAVLGIQHIKERLDGEAMQKKHKAQLQQLMLTAGKILSPSEKEEKLELERLIQEWDERKQVIAQSSSSIAHISIPTVTTTKYETTVSSVPGTTLEKITIPLVTLARHFKCDYKEFQKKYLIDTPGIRAEDDLTTRLTLDELKVSLPKKVLTPRSFMIEEGKSFFMGGLIRIDCVPQEIALLNETILGSRDSRRSPALKLTFFTALPFHKTSMAQADQLLKRSRAGQLTVLQPPFGSPERLALFPHLTPIRQGLVRIDLPRKHVLDGEGSDRLDNSVNKRRLTDKRGRRIMPFDNFEGICDIVFPGGLGWVMVSALPVAEAVPPIKLRVWTPGGKGMGIRPECLLPELADDHLERTAGGIRQKSKLFQPLPPAMKTN